MKKKERNLNHFPQLSKVILRRQNRIDSRNKQKCINSQVIILKSAWKIALHSMTRAEANFHMQYLMIVLLIQGNI